MTLNSSIKAFNHLFEIFGSFFYAWHLFCIKMNRFRALVSSNVLFDLGVLSKKLNISFRKQYETTN